MISILMQHSRQAPPPLTSPHGSLHHELQSIVMRCLEKDPAARPADALEIERALAGCAAGWSQEEAAEWWQIHLPDAEMESRSVAALVTA